MFTGDHVKGTCEFFVQIWGWGGGLARQKQGAVSKTSDVSFRHRTLLTALSEKARPASVLCFSFPGREPLVFSTARPNFSDVRVVI